MTNVYVRQILPKRSCKIVILLRTRLQLPVQPIIRCLRRTRLRLKPMFTGTLSMCAVILLHTLTLLSSIWGAPMYHYCAVTSNKTVTCWGSSGYGERGDGFIQSPNQPTNYVYERTPSAVLGLNDVTSISLGEKYSCAVLSSGALKCWGLADKGQLGCGKYAGYNAFYANPAGDTPDIGCAVNRSDGYGCSPIPVDVVGLNSGVSVVAAGSASTCAVLKSGGVKCWGSNSGGQLGTFAYKTIIPMDMPGLQSGVLDIAAGSGHFCVLLSSGGVKCWGSGAVGDNTTSSRPSPVFAVGLEGGVASVVSGGSHSCAILNTGGLKCWGYNGNGQIGDGTTTHRYLPVSVVDLDSGVASAATHSRHSCVILISGEARCWGSGYNGIVSLTPVAVDGIGSGLVAIALHTYGICALGSNGHVRCIDQWPASPSKPFQTKITNAVKLWSNACSAPLLLAFIIAFHHRIAGKSNASATISFTPYVPIASGSLITITFPEYFVLPSVTPFVLDGSSSVANLSALCSPTSPTSVILTVSGAAISASSIFSITLSGLSMGNRTGNSSNGLVGVSVNSCPISDLISSGGIFSRVLDASVGISQFDRVAGKSAVIVTLAFTSSVNMIPPGSNITLNFPIDFFAPSAPFSKAGAASVADLIVACSRTSSTSIVLTTSMAAIGISPFVVTINGFIMGSSGANVTNGIYITTTVHPDPSEGIDSGVLSCPAGSFWTGQPPECIKCPAGTYQSSSDARSCLPCDPGRFCNASGLVAVSGLCPAGSYSPSGANTSSCTFCGEGTYNSQLGQYFANACLACDRPGFTTTKERDRCVTLKFAELPPFIVFAEDSQSMLPPVALVDVDGNVVRDRSSVASATLQCNSMCNSELSASLSDYDLFPALSIYIDNGMSATIPLYFSESSQGKIGMNYVWRLSSSQENGPPWRSIPAINSFIHNISFMGNAPVYAVAPTMVAASGGSVLTVHGEWALPSRFQQFFNSSVFLCEFQYIDVSTSAAMTVQSAMFEMLDANFKTCRSPSISEFTLANLTIVFQDGRRRRIEAALSSVCHHGHYVDSRKCVKCPSSLLGGSTNNAINAPSLQDCICAIGSYGTFGPNCRLCPKPPSLRLPPFICNSTNMHHPIVVSGYWADFSLLSNCFGSAPCDAVKTCAFGDRACPGGGNKICTQNDVECYEGVACAKCCAMFYLENDVCTRCPDSSKMTVIFAVVGAVFVLVGALTASAASPSLMHSFKYLVIVLNFLQRLFSLDLIKIDWPYSITSLFSWLKLFTLSINIVRPECSFNWNFQTKVIITLLSPVCVSLILLCCGMAYGCYSCRRFWIQLNRHSNSFSTKMRTSFRSLCRFWVEIVLYRNVDSNCQNVMWAALYPGLMQRKRRRASLTASENWRCLRQKICSARKDVSASAPLQSRSQQMRYALEHFETFDSAQQSARDAGFDLVFANIVTNGRKFASAMFSVLVITFVGTLSSVLSVWDCKMRDGSVYLSEDATIECSLESSEYRRLFYVSMFGLFLYGVALPASIFFLFKSRWCKELMIYDFGAFESLFGFLTMRYSSEYYMWEVVIFVQKTVSVLIPTYVTDAIRQSVFMMLASLLYLILIFIYSPFSNGLLNFVEKIANLSVFLLYFSALLFVVEVDGALVLEGTLKELLGLGLCALCALSVSVAFGCAWYEWLQLAFLHKVKVISNWMKCLRFAIGSSFSGDNAFSLLFVLYNPVSRRDVANKQHQFNQDLANALLPLHQQYLKQSGSYMFGIKRAWICFKFAITNFDEDCSPVSVLAAVQEPHTRFMKQVARLNVLIKNGTEMHDKKTLSFLCATRNFWNCQNNVYPELMEQEVESDAPKKFIEELISKRNFVAENFDEESRLTITTLLLFNDMEDFGEGSADRRYLNKMFDEGVACRLAMRSMYGALEELSKRVVANNERRGFFASFWRLLPSWLLLTVFGQGTVDSIYSFYCLNSEQQNELMQKHNFPSIDTIKFSAMTADDIANQFLAEGRLQQDSANHGADMQSFTRNKPDPTKTHFVDEQQPVHSAPQNLQAASRRILDLETQLSESKAENLQLRKALLASQI